MMLTMCTISSVHFHVCSSQSLGLIVFFVFFFVTGFLRKRYGAIALYKLSSGAVLSEGMSLSYEGVVDAVVYLPEDASNVLSSQLLLDSMPVRLIIVVFHYCSARGGVSPLI